MRQTKILPICKYGIKCRCSNGNDIWYEPLNDEVDGWVERTPDGAITKVTMDSRLIWYTPKFAIQYFDQIGFPKLTKWQKFELYLFYYWIGFKTFLKYRRRIYNKAYFRK